MPISLTSSLEHVAWAEQAFFAQLASVPEEFYSASYADPEWNVAHIAWHIASGATWYEFCLTGVDHDVPLAPQSREEMAALGEFLTARTLVLVQQTHLDDEVLHVVAPGEEFEVRRSTLLIQAVHHSVEHRAHIASALEAHGYRGMDLDAIDAWAFAAATN